MNSKNSYSPYTKLLIFCAFQVAFISFLFAYYSVDTGVLWKPITFWMLNRLKDIPFINEASKSIQNALPSVDSIMEPKKLSKKTPIEKDNIEADILPHFKANLQQSDLSSMPVFTKEQLSFFDGSRPSKNVYLAFLGRVYDVERGRKHYGPGGGYHFFAGRDATRAFVTGDFGETGLIDDISDLENQDLLSLLQWSNFYERDYTFVGLLQGTFHDATGHPTKKLEEIAHRIEQAKKWREAQTREAELFPPCNSEWHKDSGGRVWCTTKSGGVHRAWSGVPRKFFNPASKTHRCACVKNFGTSSIHIAGTDDLANRGDLDNPNLGEYEGCSSTANSCRVL